MYDELDDPGDDDEMDEKHIDVTSVKSDSDISEIDHTNGDPDFQFQPMPNYGESVVQQSITRTKPNLLWLRASSCVKEVYMNQRGKWKVVIEFPWMPRFDTYRDSFEGCAMEIFMNECLLDSRDSLWKVGFIREVVRGNEKLSSIFKVNVIDDFD